MATNNPVQKLTRRQAAIIGAHTGIACGPILDIRDYMYSLPAAEQARRCREDFLAICASEEDPQ